MAADVRKPGSDTLSPKRTTEIIKIQLTEKNFEHVIYLSFHLLANSNNHLRVGAGGLLEGEVPHHLSMQGETTISWAN